MKKVLCVLLSIIVFAVHPAPAVASDDIFYEDFGPFFEVALDKEWQIAFNKGNIENHVRVWIEDSSKSVVSTHQRIEANILTIGPVSNYKENEKHTLYIARTASNKLIRQQKIIFTTKQVGQPVGEVQKRRREINEYWMAIQPIHDEVSYIQEPSAVYPYRLGKLSDKTLQSALDLVNFVRFVAHLPDDVTLNEQFNSEAQAASVVNAANGSISHYPAKPEGMDQELFILGYNGARTSNLGMGFRTIIDSILYGYLYDGDPSNIDSLGHRLWILSPKLKQVGFGYASGYTAMKVIADDMYRNSHEPYEYLSWPSAVAMPIDLFDPATPWSISLDTEIYDNRSTADISVELTRLNGNKTWRFSYGSSDGYFNISTKNYGYLPFTIIFKPDDISYNAGDHFRVTVHNLKKRNGANATLSFEITLFNLGENDG